MLKILKVKMLSLVDLCYSLPGYLFGINNEDIKSILRSIFSNF